MTSQENGYYSNLDENFNVAYDLITHEQNHEELINMLKNGNIVQKQLAALKIETLYSKNEAQVLIDNLTGQDGKIREAVSLKILEFMTKSTTKGLFNLDKNCEILLSAVIDINGNVCRNIISAITNLRDNTKFCIEFSSKLITKALELANQVKDFDLQEGKYKVNKEVFKLYWYLETIFYFYEFIEINKLKELLIITKSINEYTIREKTAKILTHKFEDKDLLEIRQLLKNDTNYYVSRI